MPGLWLPLSRPPSGWKRTPRGLSACVPTPRSRRPERSFSATGGPWGRSMPDLRGGWPTVVAAGDYTEAGAPLEACDRLLEELTGEPRSGPRGPLAPCVNPGGTVVVKPNLVRDSHPQG